MKTQLSLQVRTLNALLLTYYGILEMDSVEKAHHFIYGPTTNLSESEMSNAIDEYLQELKETIDELFKETGKKS